MKPPPLVAAKLARPRPGHVLRRHRLSEALRAGVRDHPVTLVRAGAGYGKTTLVAELAEGHAEVMWYSLGPEDADGGVFLWHLVGGLQLHSRRYGRSLRALLLESESAKSLNQAAAAFLNDLSRIKKPVLIVLDDLHFVQDSAPVMEFLSTVLEHMDTPVRFVLAARQEPPLPLARLRARRQLAEIDSNDLCFSREELRALLEEVYDRAPSNQTLDFVSRTTEGWVTAIQLVLALDPGRSGLELPVALRHATEAGSSIHDYLAQEVLALQSPEDRAWLLRASIFEEMEPALVGTVLGEPDTESRLHRYVKRSLVHPFDTAQGRIFRYHALLADFLFRRFQAEVPQAERTRLHHAAAAAFLGRDNLVGAARQLALSGDTDALAGFLRDHALRLLEQGHYQVLLSWFEGLPSSVFDQEPRLRLRLGDVRHYLGDWPGAELEYERAQSEFVRRGEEDAEAWAVLGLLRIWNLRGESARVVAEGERVIAAVEGRSGADQDDLLIRLLQVVSGARFYMGRYNDALALLDRMEPRLQGNPDRQAALWNNRGVVWASQGNYQKAVQAFERGLERPGARRSPRASLHLCNLALTLSEIGDTERAQILFQEAGNLANAYRNRSQVLSCQIGLANLYFRLGNVEKTLELIKETESINADLKIPLVESYTLALRARLLCEGGQYGAARAALTRALAACSASGRDANWLSYRIQVAVVDLRAGRIKEAHQALLDLLPLAMEMEAWYPRTLLLFHLGDTELRLGSDTAEQHLADALTMGEEMGYEAFFRDELRRSFDPFSFLLLRGRSPEYIRDLAVGAGPVMEHALLRLVGDRELPPVSVRAVLGALGEVGGPRTHERLTTEPLTPDSGFRNQVDEVLRDIGRRHPELQPRGHIDAEEVTVRTLGGLGVAVGGQDLTRDRWKSQRALHIFVYLALRRGRGTTKDRLMDLFWPGKPAAAAERNFHPTLSYVRAAFKGLIDVPVLPTGDRVYDLHPDLKITVDARRFEIQASEAKAVRDPRDRLAALEAALALYRGDFLSEVYDPWTEELRAGFSDTFEQTLEEAAGLRFELEDHAAALELYRRLAGRNPFREEIHSRIMMCYHHLGDRRSLKQQFGSLQRILRDELDVDPLPATSALYETLMASL